LDFDSFDDLDLAVSGSGNIHLKGNKAGDVTAAILGSGNIDCINVRCDNARAKISGSGNIKVDAAKVLMHLSVAVVMFITRRKLVI